MVALTDEQRKKIARKFQSDASRTRERLPGVSKHDIRDAVDATDQWIEDNKASFVAALPEIVRTNLAGKQLVRLFVEVASERWGVL